VTAADGFTQERGEGQPGRTRETAMTETAIAEHALIGDLDSAVLLTRFFSVEGMGQVIDFMPAAGSTATDNHRLVRMVQCVRGRSASPRTSTWRG